MGLRFTGRISIIPGLRVDLSKNWTSFTVGDRSALPARPPHDRRRLTFAFVLAAALVVICFAAQHGQ
jgi:hypothetical protein